VFGARPVTTNRRQSVSEDAWPVPEPRSIFSEATNTFFAFGVLEQHRDSLVVPADSNRHMPAWLGRIRLRDYFALVPPSNLKEIERWEEHVSSRYFPRTPEDFGRSRETGLPVPKTLNFCAVGSLACKRLSHALLDYPCSVGRDVSLVPRVGVDTQTRNRRPLIAGCGRHCRTQDDE
jgi:hypothetical protein